MKHFALALLVLIAVPVVAFGDCFSNFCHQKVQKVVVQKQVVQKVAVPVHHNFYGHHNFAYQPVGYQYARSDQSNDELTAAAIDRLADALAQRLGVNTQAVKASTALNKCAKCHGPGGPQSDLFEIPNGPLGWRTAERIQYALIETDMSERAKLNTDEFKQLLSESRAVIADYLSQPPANALPLENE